MLLRLTPLVILVVLQAAYPCHAQEEVTVETILTGLNHPWGVAVQPKSDIVYVAESGAAKVVRVVDGQVQEVIVGFPSAELGIFGLPPAGPLGLVFVDPDTLVVGDGGLEQGRDLLRIFSLDGADEAPLDAEGHFQKKDLPAVDGQSDSPGLGDFFGVAVSPTGVYVTTQGDTDNGWIGKVDRKGQEFGQLRRFVATRPEVQVPTPIGLTISPDGFVTVAQMGEITNAADAQLSFYEQQSGELKANFSTGLRDMVAVAYGPRGGRLFALDMSLADSEQGGLFKLIGRENNTKCINEKLVSLIRPTAMAFDSKGDLFVTVLGSDPSSTSGQLVKISGLDQPPQENQGSESAGKVSKQSDR